METFKVGDKVIVLDKTVKGFELDGDKWKRGDEGTIHKVYLNGFNNSTRVDYLVEKKNRTWVKGYFLHSDLQKKEENMIKYKKNDKVEVLMTFCDFIEGEIAYIHSRGYEDGNTYWNLSKTKNGEKEYGKLWYEHNLRPVNVKNLKYKSLKSLRVDCLLRQGSKGTNPTDLENTTFIQRMLVNFKYKFGDIVPMTQKFIDYIEQHPCFVDWLKINDFIEEIKEIEVFEPYDITLRINSKEEYECLYHRLNLAPSRIKDDYYEAYKIPNETMRKNDNLFSQIVRQKPKGE